MFERWRKLPASQAGSRTHLELGEYGEQLAADYLTKRGYRLVVTNFTAPIGYSLSGRPITGEIDLIAYDESVRPFVLAFVEVKTRSRSEFAAPEAAVDLRKQRQIARTARIYRRMLLIPDEPYRYDVVSIVASPGQTPHIELLRGYFNERSFARSRWLRLEI
jgi:putative endonuclease